MNKQTTEMNIKRESISTFYNRENVRNQQGGLDFKNLKRKVTRDSKGIR